MTKANFVLEKWTLWYNDICKSNENLKLIYTWMKSLI